ncbi:MAG: C26 family cysteine hydrolase domain-containing family, partial [Porticoccaceae bacterium]|nr:C26 family cysteine hydrolase domain-containing family [Porticoccaceae bacterium]
MPSALPIVGIACDVITAGLHQFHGAGEKYINAVAHGAAAMPVLLPAFGEGTDIKDLNG